MQKCTKNDKYQVCGWHHSDIDDSHDDYCDGDKQLVLQTPSLHELRPGHRGDAAQREHARRQEERRLLWRLHQREVRGAQRCSCCEFDILYYINLK